jgi:hypothetical protein
MDKYLSFVGLVILVIGSLVASPPLHFWLEGFAAALILYSFFKRVPGAWLWWGLACATGVVVAYVLDLRWLVFALLAAMLAFPVAAVIHEIVKAVLEVRSVQRDAKQFAKRLGQ